MADISSYIRSIESASRGEQVRDAIINALTAINESGGGGTETPGGDTAVTVREVHDLFLEGTYYDTAPVQNSTKAVTSGGLYNVLGDIGLALDVINGISV